MQTLHSSFIAPFLFLSTVATVICYCGRVFCVRWNVFNSAVLTTFTFSNGVGLIIWYLLKMNKTTSSFANIRHNCFTLIGNYRIINAYNLCCCVQMPSATSEWNAVAEDFLRLWNMPNCLGAIYGKLVHIQRPIKCGGQYFNYKRSFSVNMMAVVDAKYRFLYVAVGAQGSANGASVFSESKFGEALYSSSNPLSLPPAKIIPNTDI